MRVANYYVEVTPVTLHDPIAAAPPLPPIPVIPMAHVTSPEPPKFPWDMFLYSFLVVSALAAVGVAVGVGR